MAIEFTCPACNCTLRVGAGPIGRLVRCGGCVSLLRVPDVPAPPPSPRQPEPAPRPVAFAPSADESNWQHLRRRRQRIFWLMVTVGVLAIGAIVVCGGLLLIASQQKWRTFDSHAGGFQAEFPGEPRTGITVPGLRPEVGRTILAAKIGIRDEIYAVGYEELPQGKAQQLLTDEARLKQLAEKFTTGPDVKIVTRNAPLAVHGFPAHEVEYVGKDGKTYVRRQILAGTRLYTLLAGGRNSRTRHENSTRFLASFTITDEKLIAAREKRLQQEKLAAEALEQLRKRTERDKLRAVGIAAVAATFEPVEAELVRREQEREGLRAAGVVVGNAVGGALMREVQALPVAPLPRLVRP